jgi:putative peptidoglycan lipid II flippase
MIGTAGAHLGHLTDRFFASLLPAGRLSALSYAHQLTYVPLNVLVTSLVTVLFPYLSRRAGSAAYGDVSSKLGRAVSMLFAIVLPLAVAIGVLHEPLVRLVYERGAFTADSTRVTGETVLFYAVGLPASAVSMVLSYGFYSVEDTKTPMTAGLVRIAVKLILSLALVGSLAHVGLALAESLSLCVKTVVLAALLPATLRQGYSRVLRSLALTSGLGAAMGLVLLTVLTSMDDFLGSGASTPAVAGVVALTAAVGGASYLALSLLFQPVEVRDLYRVVRSGLTRRA